MKKMDNNNNNLPCSYAESLIDYLYGECSIAEKSRMEAHLKDCLDCSFVLEEITFARNAVADWKELEFVKLLTPPITLKPAISRESAGLLSNFKIFIASLLSMPRLAAAGTAFVILLALIGGFSLVLRDGSVNESAAVNSDVNKGDTALSPSVDPARKQNEQQEASPNTTQVAENNRKVVAVSEDELLPRGKRPVVNRRSYKKSTLRNETAVTISKGAERQLPRLNDFEDYQDKSLRLSDILDEIDSGT
ncbi:MAG TPA: hypothetical protein DEA22_03670 [Blastocatellia bacterium]|nr:hypothetical protein [Blastocatellia bacterium]